FPNEAVNHSGPAIDYSSVQHVTVLDSRTKYSHMAPQRGIRANTCASPDLRVVTYHYRSPQGRPAVHNSSFTHLDFAGSGVPVFNHAPNRGLEIFWDKLICFQNIFRTSSILPPT